jgi:hypothetical protein
MFITIMQKILDFHICILVLIVRRTAHHVSCIMQTLTAQHQPSVQIFVSIGAFGKGFSPVKWIPTILLELTLIEVPDVHIIIPA